VLRVAVLKFLDTLYFFDVRAVDSRRRGFQTRGANDARVQGLAFFCPVDKQ
jgi:hypothetical protein